MAVDLSRYDNSWYPPGRNRVVRALWYVVNALLLQNPLNPSSGLKVFCLRLFGAKIGVGVNLKPSINVKYPWNLEIGEHSWIGEKVWIDSLATIKVGSNVCISQGAYLCTGNHDWSTPTFGLVVEPVFVEEGAWIGAHVKILPGVTIGNHTVITTGSVVTQSTEPYMVYSGNPSVAVKKRQLS